MSSQAADLAPGSGALPRFVETMSSHPSEPLALLVNHEMQAPAASPAGPAAPASVAVRCAAAGILGSPLEGATSVQGQATPSPASATEKARVGIRVDGAPVQLKAGTQTSLFINVDSDGRFVADLPIPLAAGQVIFVEQRLPDNYQCAEGTSIVASATPAADTGASEALKQFNSRRAALEAAQQAQATAQAVIRAAQSRAREAQKAHDEGKRQAALTEVSAAESQRDIAAREVDERQQALDELEYSGESLASTSAAANPVMVGAAYDWGRVRAYFTTGALLSNDQGSFTRSSVFVSFNLDKNWFLPKRSSRFHRIRYNTYFDARLTAVPESQAPDPKSSDSSGSTAGQSQFLATSKAASLQVGGYLPITAANWRYRGAHNSLFVAPLAKFGFTTAISAAPTSSTSSSSTNGGGTTQSIVATTPINPDRFYKFVGYGIRIGHFKEFDSTNIAPELISYLDIVYGRFANFDLLRVGDPVEKIYHPIRPYRFGFEGLLKVPGTPFVLGLSANVSGAQKSGYQQPKDDLRFLFGAKFDVGNLISKLSVNGRLP